MQKTVEAPRDVEYLRIAVRRVLRAYPRRQGSALGDMQTREAEGEQKLARPRGKYRTERLVKNERGQYEQQEVELVKPSFGQWTNTIHAAPTRRSGRSREVVSLDSRMSSMYVQAIWRLRPVHISSILGRYAHGQDQRTMHANKIADIAVAQFSAQKVRDRARLIAIVILAGGNAERVRKRFGMTGQEWRGSNVRRTYYAVVEFLALLDVQSLEAWEAACLALDEQFLS